ncbi:CdaR family protein [Maribacter sp. 2304DJ31-5]|uniref:CdaR family protein n=1 Tax=Maribacter sp. 2304DJ31-5 TaxID=3386273 RepID=UPI0039BC617C
MILERIKTGLGKRKVKIFLVFLLFSALAWFINNLSRPIIGNAVFDLEYVNIPKAFQLSDTPKASVHVKLKAVGFQFLGFTIRKKKVKIDISKMSLKDTVFYIAPEVYKKQIERQLSYSMTLLELERDTIFLNLIKVVSKTVPVVSGVHFTLENNYALEEEISIEPATIEIRGARTEIDTIQEVRTAPIELGVLNSDFSQRVNLIRPKGLKTTIFSPDNVIVTGQIFRFSEKVIKVPVTMVNLPDGVKVRTFPDVVEVLCQGKIADLKLLDPRNFTITADYMKVVGNPENKLPLALQEYPKTISNAYLLDNEIEFILRREE